jgi:hypothetical protein
MQELRRALSILLLGACTALRAELPTAPYAAGQLELAQAELDGARGALEMQDYAMARQLAAQAQLDARLAWAMTDSPFVRRAALEIGMRAERLRLQGSPAAGVDAGPRP